MNRQEAENEPRLAKLLQEIRITDIEGAQGFMFVEDFLGALVFLPAGTNFRIDSINFDREDCSGMFDTTISMLRIGRVQRIPWDVVEVIMYGSCGR